MFNGLLKIPMQFIILFIGVLVFVFYLFNQPPIFHNKVLKEQALKTEQSSQIKSLENQYDQLYQEKRKAVDELVVAVQSDNEKQIDDSKATVLKLQEAEKIIRADMKESIGQALPGAKTQDRDYIFLNFVLTYLPHGIVGLLLAVMFSAAMSSMAGELNALSSTTTVDIYKRSIKKEGDPLHYLAASRWFTVVWALMAMLFAMLATFAENLIQFVNIVGSIFYGTILGIFLTAFYIKYVKGTAVFIAALISECIILYCFFYTDIAFLHYNIIGCANVIVLSVLIQRLQLSLQKPE
jgi:Na+(H+)/acetate symporter ActP